MNKKKLGLIVFCMLAILALFIRGIVIKVQEGHENSSMAMESGEHVVRADLAREVCLLFYSRGEAESFPQEIDYADVDVKQWYHKYINAIHGLGLTMQNKDADPEQFRPLDYITNGECEEILERISAVYGMENEEQEDALLGRIKEGTGIDTKDWEKGTFLRQESWYPILEVLAKEIGKKEIEEKVLLILETGEGKQEGEAVTDKGRYYFDGLLSADYADSAVRAVVRGDTVLYAAKTEESVTLHNAWIEESGYTQGEGKDAGPDRITLFFGGVIRTLETENALSKEVGRVVGDLAIKNKKIVGVKIKPDLVTGKVLSVDQESVVLKDKKGDRKLALAEDFKIYRIYDGLETEAARGILVGYDNMDFVVEENQVCAALIKSKPNAENIRVLIKRQDFKDLFHKEIKITGDAPFTVTCKGEEKEYGAGEEFIASSKSEGGGQERVFISSTKESGKLTLLSLTRNGINPSYRGSMEISLYEEGGLLLINEISLEEYLYAVLPSEMPSSYGVEALKVQAVCARSYAYNQLMSNSYGNYGAHVDDSISCQVYNNLPENESTIMAVKETYGQVLEYKNEIITAYYYSTSCGHTSDANDVWISEKEIPYLMGSWQTRKRTKGEEAPDLAEEESFRSFITGSPADTYDSQFAWYRWKTEISAQNLKKSIERSLEKRYRANPKLILTLNKEGDYESKPVETLGEVKDIAVLERKAGGIVTAVRIEGSKRTIKVVSEYNIRVLLAPAEDIVARQDESLVENLNMLPSAFFVVDKIAGKKEKEDRYLFTGGGYGHGVGMSQNGAKAMTDENISYEDVLKHYYQGVNIGSIY